jgi:hypothetical protein
MTLEAIQRYLLGLAQVTTAENFGYRFFFYATDQIRPFATIAESDNEYDKVSNLNREGVFRVNIGVSKDTFKALFPEENPQCDYTELNRFLPHPEYAAQHFICVLNPSGENLAQALRYIEEAHSIAKSRFEKKQK